MSGLFNCCTDGAEPDWSTFQSLEVGGCITEHEPNGDTFTVGGQPDDEAEFWTVYGRYPDGDCEAITDCKTRQVADLIMSVFKIVSRLQQKV